MSNLYFISCVRFSLQLMLSESVFTFLYSRKTHFLQRLCLSFFCFFAVAFGVFEFLKAVLGQCIAGEILYYLAVFFLTCAVMKACFDVSGKEILFAGVGGYAVQHLAYSVTMIVFRLFGSYIPQQFKFAGISVIPYILFPAVVYRAVILRYQKEIKLKEKDIRMMVLASATLFVTVVLSLMTYRIPADTRLICRIYAVLCCILILFILFYIPKENKLYHERKMLEQMIQIMGEQQQLSRENIELINRKCHDIKHQLKALMTVEEDTTRKQYAEEIKKAISLYDAVYQTGNTALDFLLREKSFLCQEYQIKFSCMADGHVLNFMDTLDIYALFGNALDNAIESVKKEPDEEKRIINMHVIQKAQILCIRIENYCNTQIQFKDGLPLSDKQDKSCHGFGVKSIRHIAEKYEGDAVLRRQDERFVLDILLPVS